MTPATLLPSLTQTAPRWRFVMARLFGRRIEAFAIDWHEGMRSRLVAYHWRGADYIASFTREPMLTPATPGQRAKLRRLLAAAEFDMNAVTFMHRRLGVADELVGQSVDTWIGGLNSLQASDLIGKLEKELA